jgi:hypothetical protein
MRLIADNKGRLTCRELFPPGTVFDAERELVSGHVVLVELVPKTTSPPKVKLVRQKGRTLLQSDRTFSLADVQHALDEFP